MLALQVMSVGGGNNSSDTLTITLDDSESRIEAPQTDGPGAAELTVYLGFRETGLVAMGTFKVTTTTYSFTMPRTMTLVGTGIDMTSPVKSPVITDHDDTTLGQIAEKVAQAAGVRAAISTGLASRAIPYLNQSSSPMTLIADLARDNDANVKFTDGTLAMTERGSGTSASGKTLATVEIDVTDLAPGSSITETARPSYGKVKASFFDFEKNQLQWIESAKSGHRSAPAYTIATPHGSQGKAQAKADSQMAALVRSTKTGTLVLARGKPEIAGASPVNVTGVREGVDDSYTAETALHSLTKENGLTTTLSVTSNGSDGTSTPDDIVSQGEDGS